jgi:valyl-tRNA synthetase
VDFIWDNFCDWYIETSKSRLFDKECDTRLEAQYLLNYVLGVSMQLLHPFMPFVTEEVYQNLEIGGKADSIMISDWPCADDIPSYAEEAEMMETLMDAIRGIRAVRKEMDVAPSRKAHIIVVTPEDKTAEMFVNGEGFLARLASVSGLETRKDKEGIPSTAVAAMFKGGEIYLPLEDLIDISKELERLGKEKERLEGEINRVSGKLANESFVSRAPAAVVDQERARLVKYEEMHKNITERIAILSK